MPCRIYSISLLVILLAVNSVSARLLPECGVDDIDLSPLANRTKDLTSSDNVFNYYLRVCSQVLDPACQSSKPGSMFCQRPQPQYGSGAYSLAYFDKTPLGVWTRLPDNEGVSVVYTNGDGNCYNSATGQTENRQLTMTFTCDPSADGDNFKFQTSQADECQYSAYYSTKYACPVATPTPQVQVLPMITRSGSSANSMSISPIIAGAIGAGSALVLVIAILAIYCLVKARNGQRETFQPLDNVNGGRNLELGNSNYIAAP